MNRPIRMLLIKCETVMGDRVEEETVMQVEEKISDESAVKEGTVMEV